MRSFAFGPVGALIIGLLLLGSGCEDATTTPLPSSGTTTGARDGGSTSTSDDPTTTRRDGMLRIGQLNVRRYFDASCDSGQCGTGGFEDLPSQSDFEKRTTQLAKGLARLEADVITLAEVENEACLTALQTELKTLGFDYPVAYIGETGLAGSVDVAVLARGKLTSVKTYRKETPLVRADGTKTQFTRELPEVHLRIGSNDVVVFAAHFRSKADDDPGRRLAEAKAAHDIVVATGKENADALVLLGGDLNDVPGSEAIDAMEAGGALVRVARDVPADAQGTYTYSGEKQAIDHIFTTEARADAYVAKSATVVRDGNGGLAGSDHAAIYADFTLP